MMCQLYHPALARAYGVVNDGPHCALVMHYYRRGSLADAITSLWFQGLSLVDRLRLGVQVRVRRSLRKGASESPCRRQRLVYPSCT
jgi:hypothetical protein